MPTKELLFSRLEGHSDLPTPPGIALQLIDLINDPDTSVQQLVELVKNDPALSSRILRTANSPLFCLQRKVTSLNHAVALLGFHVVQTLALSFSLANNLIDSGKSSLDLTPFWKRSVFSATAAQELGNRSKLRETETLFMGGLLQDIGILILNQVFSDSYPPVIEAARNNHELLTNLEKEVFGADHTEVGAWLFDQWNLPDILQEMIRHSHYRGHMELTHRERIVCISLSNLLADIWQDSVHHDFSMIFETLAGDLFDFGEIDNVLETVDQKLPEVFQLFEIQVQSEKQRQAILARSRETLFLASVTRDQKVKNRIENLESEVNQLRSKVQTDPLTGLSNRSHFDHALNEVFLLAKGKECEIAIFVCDIDHFKRFNDKYGHSAGDKVLIEVASILKKQIRQADIIRFGGEEFVLILKNVSSDQTDMIGERLRKAVSEQPINLGSGVSVNVTISIGYIHYTGQPSFQKPADLFEAADTAMYQAKATGRNKTVSYSELRSLEEGFHLSGPFSKSVH